MDTHPPIRELVNRWRSHAKDMSPEKAEVLYAAADDLTELLNVLYRRAVDHHIQVCKGLPGNFSQRVLNIT